MILKKARSIFGGFPLHSIKQLYISGKDGGDLQKTLTENVTPNLGPSVVMAPFMVSLGHG